MYTVTVFMISTLHCCIRSLRSHSYCFYKNVDKENVLVVVVSSW